MKEVRKIVAANLKHAYTKAANRYNKDKKPRSFTPGEIVYRRNFVLSDKGKKICAKLCNKFVKCKVVRLKGSNACELADMSDKSLGIFHLKDIIKA